MWRKILGLFGRKQPPQDVDPDQEILQEVQAVKKLLRKQTILLEKTREELLDQKERKALQDLAPLLAFADAFFYLDRSFQEVEDLSPQRRQALEMVWHKLDRMLAAAEIKMIRQTNIPFDEHLHEAVENLSPNGLQPEVLSVVQPGYVHNGRVSRAAKVIVGRAHDEYSDDDNDHLIIEETASDAEYHLRD